eukprot:gnl/TRDRNA2_/TRDRNA2_162784_c2_seq1.p1 gnl/TRDRNA2_/TRDRNA2_162784_c2~~gnl/TRDRNA2_/TRDRNA2_162784_c2_seq1.p1  ORF type:complete len:266 (+),score=26.78 gnl/TRDRNA2_/TRDRNA2_162784_c2_seq1:60-800(+)
MVSVHQELLKLQQQQEGATISTSERSEGGQVDVGSFKETIEWSLGLRTLREKLAHYARTNASDLSDPVSTHSLDAADVHAPDPASAASGRQSISGLGTEQSDICVSPVSALPGCLGSPQALAGRVKLRLPTVCEERAGQASDSQDLARPGLLTDFRFKEAMVGDLIKQWNFRVPAGQCCLWHSALRDLKAVYKTLGARRCVPGFQVYSGAQCPKCGVTENPENEDSQESAFRCGICGYGGDSDVEG